MLLLGTKHPPAKLMTINPASRLAAGKNAGSECLMYPVSDFRKGENLVSDLIGIHNVNPPAFGQSPGDRAFSGSDSADNADDRRFSGTVIFGRHREGSERRKGSGNPLQEELLKVRPHR